MILQVHLVAALKQRALQLQLGGHYSEKNVLFQMNVHFMTWCICDAFASMCSTLLVFIITNLILAGLCYEFDQVS